MTLPTPEEFWGELDCAADVPLHISDRLNKAYAAAYALTETQAKRITELEADLSRAKSLNGMHMKRAIDAGGERDAALASLTELQDDLEILAETACHDEECCGDPCHCHIATLRALAAATPGRGEKLLAVVEVARGHDETNWWAGQSTCRLCEALAVLDANGAVS